MNIKECEGCKKSFMAPFAPCPDGLDGCIVAHYDEKSWLCPHCGHDNCAAVRKASQGPQTMEIGMGVGNLGSVMKLDLYKEKE